MLLKVELFSQFHIVYYRNTIDLYIDLATYSLAGICLLVSCYVCVDPLLLLYPLEHLI